MDVFSMGCQKFMDRPVVAGEIDGESPPNPRSNATAFKEKHHVKQITRVLAVKRRDKLAGIQFVMIKHGNGKAPGETPLRLR